MNNEEKSYIADVLDAIVKSIAGIAVIAAFTYSAFLFKTGRLVEEKYQDSWTFKMCSFLLSDKMISSAQEKAQEKEMALNLSVTFSFKNASASTLGFIYDELSFIDLAQTAEQVNLSKELNEIQRVLHSLTGTPSVSDGWIYAGAMNNGTDTWHTKYFAFEDLIVGGYYVAANALNLRKSPPSNVTGTWKKGDVVGGLKTDDEFVVKSIKTIPGKNNLTLYWVEISIKN